MGIGTRDDERVSPESIVQTLRESGSSLVQTPLIQEGSPAWRHEVLQLMRTVAREMRTVLDFVPTSIEENWYLAPIVRDCIRRACVQGDRTVALSPPTDILSLFFDQAYGLSYENLVRFASQDKEDHSPELPPGIPLPTQQYLARLQEELHTPERQEQKDSDAA
ncbi:MAG: hypothetical protein PHU04_01150 [Candidatus Peribacteraceae bacterium]|nr:hypothetical protein [Candidatus Peribacteraceae bacterium]